MNPILLILIITGFMILSASILGYIENKIYKSKSKNIIISWLKSEESMTGFQFLLITIVLIMFASATLFLTYKEVFLN